MLRRAFWILVVGLFLPTLGSCLLSPKEKPGGETPPVSTYRDLETRDNLLYNLQLAYNDRNYEEFRKLLDPEVFTFFFSATDVDQGIVRNPQWDIAQELSATQALFNRSPPPGQPVADRVVLELTYSDGDDEWQPFSPETHPTETWYQKPVDYRLEVKVGDTTYNQNRVVTAIFTARLVEDENGSRWQIAKWQDDI